MIKLVIFDLDGTLFDTEEIFHDAWLKTGKKYGIDVSEEFLVKLTGSSLEEEKEIYKQYPDYLKFVDEAIQMGRANVTKVIQEKIDISRKGAHELISYLNDEGYKIAIASNSKIPHVIGMANTLGQDLVNKFDVIKSAEEVAAGKPAPDIFITTALECDVSAQHTLVVEDSINGLKAAKAAGMRTILIKSVLPISKEKESLADAIVEDHFEIIELLKKKAID